MGERVIVIGAGPGGLASAMLLASAGFDVDVIERMDRVGGRTSTLEADGFRFDMGPTFFLYPQVLEGIFEQCGRSLRDEVDLVRLDPQYRLAFEDSTRDEPTYLDCTPEVERMEAEIAKISPRDAGGLRPYLEDNRKKLEAFQPVLESPFSGLRDLFDLPLQKVLPLLRPLSSVDRDLGRHFRDPRVRLAFSFQSKYLGMSPFRCPSLFTILSFIEYEYGVFHPRGGCGAVSRAMARVAEDLGATFHLGEEVEEILFEGDRAVGVRTDRREARGDALVINADFARAMSRLVPDRLRRRWRDEKLAKKKYSCSTFMMYLGVDGELPDLAHHTIFLAEDYKRGLREIESDHVLSENPSFYVQNPSVTDESLAPAGQSALYVLVPVTHLHENVDWARDTPAFRRRVYRQLEKIGLHDLEKRVRYEKILTPRHWADDMEIYRGATFNLAHSLDQMLHLRPNNRFEELDGVYLVGGGTHPGSGLPVIYESAKITSRLLSQDFGRSGTWRPRLVRPERPAATPIETLHEEWSRPAAAARARAG